MTSKLLNAESAVKDSIAILNSTIRDIEDVCTKPTDDKFGKYLVDRTCNI